MSTILYINACVRADSRTKRIADALIAKLAGEVRELRLSDCDFPDVDEAFLNKRDSLISSGDFADPIFAPAKEFAAADVIVIAAPLWDLSFPSTLKRYLEQVCVIGVTFGYTEEGAAFGMCRAKKLYYVTTAGGNNCPDEYGYGYVKALARTFYGIPETELIKASCLDIDGRDADAIVRECIESLPEHI